MKKTDLHVKIQLQKCLSPLLKILALENEHKLVYAAPNKGTTNLY